MTCRFTVALAVPTAPKGNRFQHTFLIPEVQLGSQRLHSTEDVTQHSLCISNGQEISIRAVFQDGVSVELSLQSFEVYKMNLENSLLWEMKT